MTEKITIESEINAPVERVWECWTKPEHIVQWNFASDEWCCPKAENDLRVGGKFFSRMEPKDGGAGFDFQGVYDEIELNEKIAYTMSDDRRVTTQFNDLGDKTTVTTTFDAERENPVEMQKKGWQAILNNFKQYVEEGK